MGKTVQAEGTWGKQEEKHGEGKSFAAGAVEAQLDWSMETIKGERRVVKVGLGWSKERLHSLGPPELSEHVLCALTTARLTTLLSPQIPHTSL